MFGQQTDDQQQTNPTNPSFAPQSVTSDDTATSAPTLSSSEATTQTFPASLPTNDQSTTDTVATNTSSEGETTDSPSSLDQEAPESTNSEPKEEPSFTEISEEDIKSDEPAKSSQSDDLSAIKKDAVAELSPLVGHLEQDPIEKFRTLMLLIQSTDDQSLLKEALDVAKLIEEDKEKAKALLAVINEIDYFSQDNTNEAKDNESL